MNYEELKKYRGILELFAKCGEYVGGADALMDFYNFNDRRCPSCVGAWLIERANELKKYDREHQG